MSDAGSAFNISQRRFEQRERALELAKLTNLKVCQLQRIVVLTQQRTPVSVLSAPGALPPASASASVASSSSSSAASAAASAASAAAAAAAAARPVHIVSLTSAFDTNQHYVVMYLSNNDLLFRFVDDTDVPVLRSFRWIEDAQKAIVAMRFSPDLQWLLCLCRDGSLYLLSCSTLVARYVMSHSALRASGQDAAVVDSGPIPSLITFAHLGQQSGLGRTQHLNALPALKKIKAPKHLGWWRSKEGQDFGIVGNQQGKVVIVNLRSGNVVFEHQSKAEIDGMQVFWDEFFDRKYLLLLQHNAVDNMILLESAGEYTYTILAPKAQLKLRPVSEKPSHVSAHQHDGRRGFIVVHDPDSNTLQLYPESRPQHPDFRYVLNSTNVAFLQVCSNILVSCSNQDGLSTLTVISRHLAGFRGSELIGSTKDSVLQRLSLPHGQLVKGMQPYLSYAQCRSRVNNDAQASFSPPSVRSPSVRLNAGKLLGGSLASDTSPDSAVAAEETEMVHDRVLLWTDDSVYMLTLAGPPSTMFCKHLDEGGSISDAERIGNTFSADMINLFALCGDSAFDRNDVDRAVSLYKAAEWSPERIVTKLLDRGKVNEAVNLLHQILYSESMEYRSRNKTEVSNLLLRCYVACALKDARLPRPPVQMTLAMRLAKAQQDRMGVRDSLTSGRSGGATTTGEPALVLLHGLIESSAEYTPELAIGLLLDQGLQEEAFMVAHARSCSGQLVSEMAKRCVADMTRPQLLQLLRDPSARTALASVARGAMLALLSPADQVEIILENPPCFGIHVDRLAALLYECPRASLEVAVSRLAPGSKYCHAAVERADASGVNADDLWRAMCTLHVVARICLRRCVRVQRSGGVVQDLDARTHALSVAASPANDLAEIAYDRGDGVGAVLPRVTWGVACSELVPKCDANVVISVSANAGDTDVLAAVYLALGQRVDALRCRLQAATAASMSDVQATEGTEGERCVRVLDEHLLSEVPKIGKAAAAKLLLSFLAYWKRRELPWDVLREHTSRHQAVVAALLAECVVASRTELAALQLPSTLLLGVASHLVEQQDSQTDDRTWLNVLTVLKRDRDARKSLVISDVRNLKAKLGADSALRVFSCGHVYPAASFRGVVAQLRQLLLHVTEAERQSKRDHRAADEMQERFDKQASAYSFLSVRGGCPVCYYNAVRPSSARPWTLGP